MNTKIDVGLVTDKPHEVEMSKKKGEGRGKKSDGGDSSTSSSSSSSSSSSRSPDSSSKFVSEIKPCQQQFRANASVSTLRSMH